MNRITIKIGTRVLTGCQNKIDRRVLKNIADQVALLMDKGIEVIIVSSGAIGAGLGLLKLGKKEKSLSELQALASVGQNHLMDMYNDCFGKRGYVAGQILLTQEDFDNRRRFLNIRYTLNTLLKHKAVPIINENDSISTEEIKCGDNDRLSYLVSDLAASDMLIILTDVDGLCDHDGKLVKHVTRVDAEVRSLCRQDKGCTESTGGMITKLDAAKNAARSGIVCVMAKGRKKNVIVDIVEGKELGTHFDVAKKEISARKRWIGYTTRPKGKVIVDSGAASALNGGKRSLLPSGIVNVKGNFADGDVIDVVTEKNVLLAKGLTNYTSLEIDKIKGLRTDRIEKVLGYKDYDEVIHRDNLVILED